MQEEEDLKLILDTDLMYATDNYICQGSYVVVVKMVCNNSWILMKIRHICWTNIYECFGAPWLNGRGIFGLGGSGPCTECLSSLFLQLFLMYQ